MPDPGGIERQTPPLVNDFHIRDRQIRKGIETFRSEPLPGMRLKLKSNCPYALRSLLYAHVTRMNEEERIRLAYSKRSGDEVLYSFFNPGHLFMAQQLEKDLVSAFRRYRLNPLGIRNKKILEVGCGTASPLREFVKYGAKPENLCGIDLLADAIEEAKRSNPGIDFRCGNAETLPYDDGIFDIVTQFVMFTSILDNGMKQNTAKEMLRVLRPDGIILWYDYFVSKPANRDVKAIGKREIVRLFPNCTFDFTKVTLAPPIARTVAPYSFFLCYLLEKIPWLRTHYLVVIKKAGSDRIC